MKTEVRYKIDKWGRGLIDQKTRKTVCHEEGIEEFFAKKKSKIRGLVSELDQQINELVRMRNDLRAKCRHLHTTAKYGSNTGNYDPSADCYWVDFYCYDCGKQWSEDQ